MVFRFSVSPNHCPSEPWGDHLSIPSGSLVTLPSSSRGLSDGTAEEHDRLVTQSMATPEPGCPDPHPRSDARRPQGP